MAVLDSSATTPARRLRRAARIASLALLVITVLFLLGTDVPAAASLRTHPYASFCFLFMLLGLAIAWQHPMQGGVATAAGALLLLGAANSAAVLPLALFLAVGVLDLVAGWRERRRPG